MIRAVVDAPDEAGMADQATLTELTWRRIMPVVAGFDIPDNERLVPLSHHLLLETREDILKENPGKKLAYLEMSEIEVRNGIFKDRAIAATFKYALVPE
jgi:hypothetical protein